MFGKTEEQRVYTWRIFDIFVIIFFAMIVIPNLVTWLIQLSYSIQGTPKGAEELKIIVLLPAIFFQEITLLWLTLASVYQGYGLPWNSIGLNRVPWIKTIGSGVLWGAGLLWAQLMAEQFSYLVFSAFLGPEVLEKTLLQENSWVATLIPPDPSSFRLVGLFLLLVVLVPVAEEVFYRGFVFQALRERFGGQWAVFLSALIFAVMHGYLIQFLPIFVIGVGLGYIVRHYGSLWPGILGHAIVNLAAYVVIIFS